MWGSRELILASPTSYNYRFFTVLVLRLLREVHLRIEANSFNQLLADFPTQRFCHTATAHGIPYGQAKHQIVSFAPVMVAIGSLVTRTVGELPHVFLVHHGIVDALVHAHIMQYHAIEHFNAWT